MSTGGSRITRGGPAMPPDRTRRGPGRNPGTRQITATAIHRQGTAVELEVVVFATAARGWLDHGLTGDVDVEESIDAALRLLDRAERLAA